MTIPEKARNTTGWKQRVARPAAPVHPAGQRFPAILTDGDLKRPGAIFTGHLLDMATNSELQTTFQVPSPKCQVSVVE